MIGTTITYTVSKCFNNAFIGTVISQKSTKLNRHRPGPRPIFETQFYQLFSHVSSCKAFEETNFIFENWWWWCIPSLYHKATFGLVWKWIWEMCVGGITAKICDFPNHYHVYHCYWHKWPQNICIPIFCFLPAFVAYWWYSHGNQKLSVWGCQGQEI